jgi:hypothetical protein
VTGITVTAGQEVVVAITDTSITNPAKVRADGIGDSYEFTISNANDTAKTRVVIIDTADFIAQQLNVTANARNGFVVSVGKDALLQSSTGADIDEFVDSADGAGTNTQLHRLHQVYYFHSARMDGGGTEGWSQLITTCRVQETTLPATTNILYGCTKPTVSGICS